MNDSALKGKLEKLENILVEEFRLSQELQGLTRQVRTALASNEPETLSKLIEQKEPLLDELHRLDEQRRGSTHELIVELGASNEGDSLGDILPLLADRPALAPTAARLARLRSGLLAVMNEVRDLARGNNALAGVAMERSAMLQSFIINAYQPPAAQPYGPPGLQPPAAPPMALEIDQWK